MTNRRNNEPPFVIFHLSFFIGHLPDLSLRPLRLCGEAFGLRLGFSVTSVVLRCEFVFFLQDFVALLWSAQACLRFKGDGTFPKRQQAAALQREAQWGVILLLVAAGLHRELCRLR